MKTGIIIPCFNEEKKINMMALLKFLKQNTKYHLCFVNDGSKDNTLKLLEKLKKKAMSYVSIVDVKRSKGKLASIKVGARYLYTREDLDCIGYVDTDLTLDYPEFIKQLEGLSANKEWVKIPNSGGEGQGRAKRNILRDLFLKIDSLHVNWFYHFKFE